jgi:Na+/proline symporter/nitrogen-specific signal transduction histidine kinase
MSLGLIIACSLAYVALLFLIAWWIDRRAGQGRSFVSSPYSYALSLAVYCTAWTFFGSVGRAATSGLSFLGVYIGPTLFAPLWYLLLQKMIAISKNQRITSVADFIASRYGKNTGIGVLVTVMVILGIIPYIALQLKAVTFGIETLTHFGRSTPAEPPHFWQNAAFWVTVAMAIFAAIFGARKLDPNERHEGLVAAIAFESIVKLAAFVLVGAFVTYWMFDGFDDLFVRAQTHAETAPLFSFSMKGITPLLSTIALSFLAIVLLPRQFHMAVVENTSRRYVAKAMWIFPLYLVVINIFVLPIALAGRLLFSADVNPDTFVLSLPLVHGHTGLALAAFIGGFSAATGMIVVEVTALSLMLSNHIVLPLLIRAKGFAAKRVLVDGEARILDVRRVSILFLLFLAYLYQRSIGAGYDLVSVGLMSFTAVAQLAPAAIGGMYWKRATRQGARAGLVAGFVLWAYCLPLPALAQAGWLPRDFIDRGLFGIALLKPQALFGLSGLDPITHAAFWSLLVNSWLYAIVSINTRPATLDLTQADLFVNIDKYIGGQDYDVIRREATMSDLRQLLIRFLGEARARLLLAEFEQQNDMRLGERQIAPPELISFAENHLAGALGSASARLVMDTVAKEEPVTLQEVMQLLDQTREAVEHSRLMEAKNEELNTLTRQLTEANEQLKALDRLQASFITTVTHELRTPVTSIKSLSHILLDYHRELSDERLREYLQIVATESDRIGRLINQVLDIEKIEAEGQPPHPEPLDLAALLRETLHNLQAVFADANVRIEAALPDDAVRVRGDRDRLIQVLVNLLSNGCKFCDPRGGVLEVSVQSAGAVAILRVKDNGAGIPERYQELIFDKFTQLQHATNGKPKGTGLGLYITKTIVEQHGGAIRVASRPGEGAEFVVTLPLLPDEEAAAAGVPAASSNHHEST